MFVALFDRPFARGAAVIFAIAIGIVGFAGPFSNFQKAGASASGPTPGHTNAPGETNCTSCHVDFPVDSGVGDIQINGIPANYLPGQQFPVSITLSEPQGVTWGFQFTAINALGGRVGTYTIPAAETGNLQLDNTIINGLERRYMMHTVNGVTSPVFSSRTWNFTWTAPAQRVGKIRFFVAGNAANSDGGPSGDYIYTDAEATLSGSAIASFDGDTSSDLSIFRPSIGVWVSQNSTDGEFIGNQFGQPGDLIAPGDYDGDGKTDLAVFRPSDGFWYIAKSGGGFATIPWGAAGDVPVTGDYDGDLKSDLAVWRPTDSTWYIYRSSDGGYDIRTFGFSTDKPVQADFDGDGKTDIAVFRPSDGVWFIQRSSNGSFLIFPFGLAGDKPVQGDYDGDGRADAALFRPSEGFWYLLRSTAGYTGGPFGVSTDTPAPADYDGDGRTDIGIYRDGTWFIVRSSDEVITIANFGLAGDIPVPAGYVPN